MGKDRETTHARPAATEDALERVLRELPDEPRWVEARGLALEGDCSVFGGGGGGWALRNDRPGARLVVVVGRPPRAAIEAALAGGAEREVLCSVDDQEATAAVLAGWTCEPATLYGLADPARLAPAAKSARPLAPDDALEHLPDELRVEIEGVRRARVVHAAFDGDVPASFAYACWRTESLFDLSIDTAPSHRRRGLARVAASTLIRAELAGGRQPVWGALASNAASHRLAESLGFAPVDAIATFSRSPR